MAAAVAAAARGPMSLLPDDFVDSGFIDNFDAKVIASTYCPWNFKKAGENPEYCLAVRHDLEPVEGQGIDTLKPVYWSCGKLTEFVPSVDGETPCNLVSEEEADWEGIYTYPVGKATGLAKSSNLAFGITKTLEAGFPVALIAAKPGACDFLVGGTYHWSRVPQPLRPGLEPRADGREQKLTVPVTIHELPGKPLGKAEKVAAAAAAKGATAKPAAATAAAAKAAPAAAAGGSLGDRVGELILTAVTEAAGEIVTKVSLAKVVMAALSGAEKMKGVKLAQNDEFLTGLGLDGESVEGL